MDEELEIDGDWPALDGEQLEELLCSEIWYREELEEPANVIHLKIEGRWLRLYFDCGIIFWRTGHDGPKEYEMPECESRVKVVDVGRKYGLVNSLLESVTGRLTSDGSEVLFRFTNGRSITFSNVGDNTTYRT